MHKQLLPFYPVLFKFITQYIEVLKTPMIGAPLLIRSKFISDGFGKAGHYPYMYRNNGKLHNLHPRE